MKGRCIAMFRKLLVKLGKEESGAILSMALIIMAAGTFIILPGLQATSSMLTISRNLENKTRAYYAAEAGIAYSVWQCRKTSTAPTDGIVSGINNMDVQLTVLKTQTLSSNAILYTVQSSTSDGLVSTAKVIVQIKQTGDQGNNIFDQAVVSLDGDIYLSGGCTIKSDDIKMIDYGDNKWTTSQSGKITTGTNSSATYRETNVFYDTGKSLSFEAAASATTGNMAYKNTASENLSTYKYISFWLYSNEPLNAGDLTFKLATGSALGGTVESISIPAVASNTGTRFKLDIGNPSTFQTLGSIGLYQVVDKGAFTCYIDNVYATNDISNGDIYANGDIILDPSAQVYGDGSATGILDIDTIGGAHLWGTQTPSAPTYETQTIDISTYYTEANIKGGTVYDSLSTAWNAADLGQITVNNTLTVNWSSYTIITGPAWVGGNCSISTDKITMGPVYVGGDLYIGGSSKVTLKGTVWVVGKLTIAGSAYIQGPYTLVADCISIEGSAQVELARGNVPFLIARGTTGAGGYAVNITGSASTSAIIYAPNGTVSITGGVGSNGYNVYGAVIGKEVRMTGSTSVKYLTGIRTMPFAPGWGLGPGPGSGGGLGGTTQITAFDYQ